MNLESIQVSHVVGDPRSVSDLRPLLSSAAFSSVIILADITWMVRSIPCYTLGGKAQNLRGSRICRVISSGLHIIGHVFSVIARDAGFPSRETVLNCA